MTDHVGDKIPCIEEDLGRTRGFVLEYTREVLDISDGKAEEEQRRCSLGSSNLMIEEPGDSKARLKHAELAVVRANTLICPRQAIARD